MNELEPTTKCNPNALEETVLGIQNSQRDTQNEASTHSALSPTSSSWNLGGARVPKTDKDALTTNTF